MVTKKSANSVVKQNLAIPVPSNQNAVLSYQHRIITLTSVLITGNQVVSGTFTTGMFLLGLDKITFNQVIYNHS